MRWRHRGHGNAAGFQHREPAGGHLRVVGSAQQHTIAGDDAEILHQYPRNPVGLRQQVGIGPAQAAGREDGHPLAPSVGDGTVQQCGGCIDPVRILQLGQVVDEFRPLLARRQMVARKRVNVGG